eukprot:TRINITY_DN1062_c0_g2_i10.p1 TRINITY_DN1062_c0_g2~~TRINITY_DN1062_c0_g2_i10.p1  ORF type:complete len:480 (-),score=40.77 TRINITY_DN1062_c0_g2_i10:3802-5127(-)
MAKTVNLVFYFALLVSIVFVSQYRLLIMNMLKAQNHRLRQLKVDNYIEGVTARYGSRDDGKPAKWINLMEALMNHIVNQNQVEQSKGRGWILQDGGHYNCVPVGKFVRGRIIIGREDMDDRDGCTPVDKQDVEIVGVVAAHHKAGTVFRKAFYYSVCSQLDINFAFMKRIDITDLKSQTQLQWSEDFSNGNFHCADSHPCNQKGLLYSSIDARDTCADLGVQCDDWFDLNCFLEGCIDKIEIDSRIRIINPVRDPFAMVISAYKYHKGESPEQWANEILLGDLGLWREEDNTERSNKKYLLNETLSSALEKYDISVALELSYRVMSNDIFNMLMLQALSPKYGNIMRSKFEDCMQNFNASMDKELDFLGFYDQGMTTKERKQLVKVGSWVSYNKNTETQVTHGHITNGNDQKELLQEAMKNHPRYEQIKKIAEILGYEASV